MVVIDTSIAYKWIREEDTRHLSLELLNRFLSGKEEVLVPDILLYELANVLSSKTELTIKDTIEAWSLFTDFNVPIFTPTANFLQKCLKFAKEYKISVYDAAYVVLAKQKKCNLITADTNLVNKLNLKFVKSLSKT